MSAAKDIQRAVNARVYASQEDVIAAIKRAAGTLGKQAEVNASDSKVTINVYPGLARKLSNISPVVGVTVRGGPDGAVLVTTKVEKYRTSQAVFLFFRVGPKELVGKGPFKNLLRALEQELSALNSDGRGSVALVAPS